MGIEGPRVAVASWLPQPQAEFLAQRLRAQGIEADVVEQTPGQGARTCDVYVGRSNLATASAILEDTSDALPVPDGWARRRSAPPAGCLIALVVVLALIVLTITVAVIQR